MTKPANTAGNDARRAVRINRLFLRITEGSDRRKHTPAAISRAAKCACRRRATIGLSGCQRKLTRWIKTSDHPITQNRKRRSDLLRSMDQRRNKSSAAITISMRRLCIKADSITTYKHTPRTERAALSLLAQVAEMKNLRLLFDDEEQPKRCTTNDVGSCVLAR